jgi:hypothetical protein
VLPAIELGDIPQQLSLTCRDTGMELVDPMDDLVIEKSSCV